MKRLSERRLSARRPSYKHDSEPDEGSGPGKASRYITHLRRVCRERADAGETSLPVVFHGRVSSDKQRRGGNLARQMQRLPLRVTRLAMRYGLTVKRIGQFEETLHGWQLGKDERPELVRAAELAKRTGAVVVARHTSRFLRNRDFAAQRSLPTTREFEGLIELVGGVQLATLEHPDRQDNRSADTRRGLLARKSSSGRPKKRHYQPRYSACMAELARVLKLRQRGKSWRAIARRLGRSESTLRGWARKAPDGE